MEKIKRTCQIERSSVDAEKRQVQLSFSSEEPIKDYSWDPPQILLHTKKAVGLSRIRDVGAVLFNHDPSRIIGSIVRIWLDEDDHKGRAIARFDETEEGNLAFERVQSESLRGVSVSTLIIERQKIEERESWEAPDGRTFKGPVSVVTKWEPVELSLTVVPADAGVGINRDLKEVGMKIPAEIREDLITRGLIEEGATDDEVFEVLRTLEPPKKEEQPKKEEPPKSDDNIPDELDVMARIRKAEEGERLAIQRERSRVEELTKIQQKSGMPAHELERWITSGVDLAMARETALEYMSARHRPVGPGGQRVDVVLDAREKHRRAVENHLLRRVAGVINTGPDLWKWDEKACEDISPQLPLIETARQCLIHAGVRDAIRMDHTQVAMRALQHSTSDFPYLLENVANKSLGVGYDEARVTWREWCGVGSLADFKSASRVAVGDSDSFAVVKELMPITEGTISEKRETRSLLTYAKRFGVSRQGIINDDLGEFSRIPQKLGAAAARTVNSKVYEQFTTPPTMAEDSVVLFSISHTSGSNLTPATGTAISLTSLGVALGLMRKQKGVGVKAYMNVVPRYLIVPAELEAVARQTVEPPFNPATTANTRLGFISSLTVVVEPLLSDESAAEWYLAAAPTDIDTVRVEFLNGQQTPQIIRADGTAILGTEWIAYLDFSAKVFDHRGLYMNVGA
jgi:hypothetical protein